MRLKSIGVLRGYAMGKTQLSKIADNIEREVKEALEFERSENAKLRMLIDLKQTCWKYVGWCSECPYNGLDDEHDDCNCMVREKVNSLARELRVEVDE